MKNYDRIESAVVSVMRRHGCKIIQTPTFEDYDTYGTYFPQLQREMIKTIGPDGEVLVMRPDGGPGVSGSVPAFEVWLCVHGVP